MQERNRSIPGFHVSTLLSIIVPYCASATLRLHTRNNSAFAAGRKATGISGSAHKAFWLERLVVARQ